ncbi:MAG TPA: glycosyltransferase [Bacillales bacterium]|nr:glycosyltransferase [Bacillales bacterium]
MRILHLSHDALPDWRVEKSAITSSNLGYDVMFAGATGDKSNYNRKTFSKVYEVDWTAKARYGIPFYWSSVKKQIIRVINEAKPDLVHAHNIFSAKMVSELKLPFVYDDHEYWSKHSQFLTEMEKLAQTTKHNVNKFNLFLANAIKKTRRNVLNRHAINLWTRWEKGLVSSTPTITVSNEIASDFRAIGNSADSIFVVPNFPMKSEIENFEKPLFHGKLSSVYAGSDGHNKQQFPNRNIDGLYDMFLNQDIGDLTIIGWSDTSSKKIRYTGYLDRHDMYKEMTNHSIGLIPFKKHWSHYYTNPNKAYEYAHAGLFVMSVSSLKPVREILKEHCVTFEDSMDMASKLMYFKENLDELHNRRLKLFNYAKDNLIWEKNEKNILNAYKMC